MSCNHKLLVSMPTIAHNPWMKHPAYIVRGCFENAIIRFDIMKGNPNKTMVRTRPMAVETQPLTNEPIISPRMHKVARAEIRISRYKTGIPDYPFPILTDP